LANTIGKLVPQAQAKGLEDVGQNLLNQSETKYVVCLATDAVSSTQLHAEQKSEDSFEFQNRYFAALSHPLHKYEPDFREFHADGSLFSWNVEDSNGLAKERACFAAIEALDSIDSFNRDIAPAKLGIRIGLHAGNVSFGFIGDEDRVVFRGIGSTINATSRVEGVNKYLKTRLLATQSVVSGLESLLLRPLGQFRLVGLDTPIDLFEVRGVRETATAENMELCLRFAEAIDAFQQHHWTDAAKLAASIQRDFHEDGPSEFLERECRVRMESSANDMDASVFKMAAK
jgi:adenylate cyclase